ncbi:MAG: hypothetical protein WC943_15140, partial [Elusimicrobiota bacterium]
MRAGVLAAVLAWSLAASAAAQVKSVSLPKAGAGVQTGLPAAAGAGISAAPSLAPLKLELGSGIGSFPAPAIRLAPEAVSPVSAEPGIRAAAEVPGLSASPAEAPLSAESGSVALPEAAKPVAAELSESNARAESPEGFFPRLKKLFDGSAKLADAPELQVPEYMRTAPESLLPHASAAPSWNRLGKASGESKLAFERALKKALPSPTPAVPLSVEALPQALVEVQQADSDGVVRQAWDLPSGARGAQAGFKGLFWIDADGRLVRRDLETGAMTAYASPSGMVSRFVLAQNDWVFVVVGGALERWDLDDRDAEVISPAGFDASSLTHMVFAEEGKFSGETFFYHATGRLAWSSSSRSEEVGGLVMTRDGENQEKPIPAGKGFYFAVEGGKTRLWKRKGEYSPLESWGEIPFEVRSIGTDDGAVFAAVDDGVVEWDFSRGEYRLFRVPGFSALPGPKRVDVDADRLILSAGSRVLELDKDALRVRKNTQADRTRRWAEKNPMYVEGGYLRIGEFKFKIAHRTAPSRPWIERAWASVRRFFGRSAPPAVALERGISEKDWKALNLPSNKRLIYDTLKGFTLHQ